MTKERRQNPRIGAMMHCNNARKHLVLAVSELRGVQTYLRDKCSKSRWTDLATESELRYIESMVSEINHFLSGVPMHDVENCILE